MVHNKKILSGLDHSQYEHPFDQKALAALEGTPGLSAAGKFITKHMVERVYTVQYTGSHLKVTSDNYPEIYEYLKYASRILDVKKIPELYIEWGYNINACTVGIPLLHQQQESVQYLMISFFWRSQKLLF